MSTHAHIHTHTCTGALAYPYAHACTLTCVYTISHGSKSKLDVTEENGEMFWMHQDAVRWLGHQGGTEPGRKHFYREHRKRTSGRPMLEGAVVENCEENQRKTAYQQYKKSKIPKKINQKGIYTHVFCKDQMMNLSRATEKKTFLMYFLMEIRK